MYIYIYIYIEAASGKVAQRAYGNEIGGADIIYIYMCVRVYIHIYIYIDR